VEGFVRDTSGAPVGGAEVRVGSVEQIAFFMPGAARGGHPGDAVSNGEGFFTLRDLPRGVQNIWVSHGDYLPLLVPAVEAPTAQPLEVVLEKGAQIVGRVVDGSGVPVAGVQVVAGRDLAGAADGQIPWMLRHRTATTAEDGTFEVAPLSPGAWRLDVQNRGFLPHRQPVEVLPQGSEFVEIVLRRGATLKGRVLGPQGTAAAQAHVAYSGERWGHSFSQGLTSDREGRFQFSGLEVGPLEVTARHDDLGKASRWVEIEEGENTVEIRLEARPGISGRVVDAAGAPAVGAEVILRHDKGGAHRSSKEGGRFHFHHLEPGEYTLVARGNGSAPSSPRKILLTEQTVEGIELRLQPGVELTGTLHGLTLAQLGRTSVTAYHLGGAATQTLSGPADLDARYRLEGLSPGSWQVNARVEGGPSERETLTVEEGDRGLELDFHFEGTSVFTVRLLHNGAPMPQVQVALYREGRSASGTTNPQGEARIEGLSAGRYRLSVALAWAREARDVEVWDGGETVIDLESGRLVGTLRSAADGMPVEGASLRATPLDGSGGAGFGNRGMALPVGTGGTFDHPIAPGTYQIVATAEGFSLERLEVEVVAGGVTPLEVELRPVGSAEIIVLYADGRVPDQVVLYALDSAGHLLLQRSLRARGPDGRFPMPVLDPGAKVTLYADGAAFFSVAAAQLRDGARVVLLPGSTLELRTLEDASGSTGTLRLVGPDGAVLGPATLGLGSEIWPVAGGFQRIPGLAPGVWTFQITLPDGRSQEGTFTALPGQVIPLEIE
jgi:hypothetical protein